MKFIHKCDCGEGIIYENKDLKNGIIYLVRNWFDCELISEKSDKMLGIKYNKKYFYNLNLRSDIKKQKSKIIKSKCPSCGVIDHEIKVLSYECDMIKWEEPIISNIFNDSNLDEHKWYEIDYRLWWHLSGITEAGKHEIANLYKPVNYSSNYYKIDKEFYDEAMSNKK